VLLVPAIALVLVGKVLVAAQSPQQYYGGPGGEITGYVIGTDNTPFDWALIYAKSATHTFQAFSGMSGMYQLRVPVGGYNVTTNVPGFRANSGRVNVTLNSSNTVNFQLQRSDLPVPEFQRGTTFLVTALIFTIALALRKHSSLRSYSLATPS